MREYDLNSAQFADTIGFSPGLISLVLNGKSPATDKFIKAVCFKFKLSEEWLKTGEGPMKSDVELSPSEEESAVVAKASSEEFVTIPRFSDRISAGGGLVPINEVDIKVAFRKDWILKKGDPRKMSLISVKGDSMEPTLMTDDLVLINHGHNHLDPQGGIYAIALDDCILIKRLQMVYPSGLVKVISDNNRYDSTELPLEQVRINGRVIWFGREI